MKVFILFLFTLFLSCSLFEKKNPDMREYFPLEVGNWWEYVIMRYDITEFDTNFEETMRLKYMVEGKRNINNKEFFILIPYLYESEGEGWRKLSEYALYMRNEGDFLLISEPLLIYGQDSLGNYIPKETIFKIIDTLFHHPNFEERKKWRLNWYPFEAEGEGEVAFGIYKCIKVNYTCYSDYGTDYFYFFVYFTECVPSKGSLWFAKDVGIVKAEFLEVYDEETGDYVWVTVNIIDYYIKKGGKNEN